MNVTVNKSCAICKYDTQDIDRTPCNMCENYSFFQSKGNDCFNHATEKDVDNLKQGDKISVASCKCIFLFLLDTTYYVCLEEEYSNLKGKNIYTCYKDDIIPVVKKMTYSEIVDRAIRYHCSLDNKNIRLDQLAHILKFVKQLELENDN